MKKLFVLLVIIFISLSAYSSTYSFSDLKSELKQIEAQPKAMKEELETKIMHPLVKMKSIIVVSTSDLIWNGSKCTKKVTSYKQVQGKKAKQKGNPVGKEFNHQYIPDDLLYLINNKNIKNWKASSNLELYKKKFNGYRFEINHNGNAKECCVFQNKDKSLHALSIGFADAQIDKGGNIKDPGIVWFFSGKGSNIKIVKVVTLELKKSSNIPYVNLKTIQYSKF